MGKTKKSWLFNKVNLVLCFLVFGALSMQAQTSGQLFNEDGDPLIGASVMVQGSSMGTITDIDGKFTINANPGDVLVLNYLGYDEQMVTVDGSMISMALVPDAFSLNEVVVVGYGTRKRSHNTGAIAQVQGADVAAIQATRVDDALAGKLAGVLIQNQDGAPGADPKIQIRAASSISGDSNPLIVVDGYPISGSLATVNPIAART